MFEKIRNYFDLQHPKVGYHTTKEAAEGLAMNLAGENLRLRQSVEDLDHERALLQNKMLNIGDQLRGLNKAVRRRNHRVGVHRNRLAELQHIVGLTIDAFEEGSNNVDPHMRQLKRLIGRIPPYGVEVPESENIGGLDESGLPDAGVGPLTASG